MYCPFKENPAKVKAGWSKVGVYLLMALLYGLKEITLSSDLCVVAM